LSRFDDELGYVGDEDGPWAVMHMQDGAVTPLLVGWERRPTDGRARRTVPAATRAVRPGAGVRARPEGRT